MQLILTRPGDRPGGDDVGERSEAIASLRQEAEAEVFRVAIRRGEHPEEQLGAQEGSQVSLALIRSLEDARDPRDAGSALRLVLLGAWCPWPDRATLARGTTWIRRGGFARTSR